MKVLSIILFTTMFFFMGKSQANNINTFDFWLGSWNAYWNDSLKGANKITKDLNDRVISENFVYNDKSFEGRSWSVYDTTSKLWRQTWVDDSGAYLLFAGGIDGDKVILRMTEKRNKNSGTVYMRMVFYNIKKESFDWDWQSSSDGKNWKSNWLINYKRKK